MAMAHHLATAGMDAALRDVSFGRAWMAMTFALAAHVTDEALTGFLSVYNPIVVAARDRFGWFPMRPFTFGVWLSGLVALIVVLMLFAPLAYRVSMVARIAAYPFAILIGVLNGFGHLAGSIYLGRWLAGATTAPLLIGCGIWLLRSVWYGAAR
jgi:hypothetical protein